MSSVCNMSEVEAGCAMLSNMVFFEVFNDLFASLFTGKSSSHTAQVTDGKGRDWETKNCRKRLGLRMSKEPESTQAHGTRGGASTGPQGNGR